jgi:hypothetical protein
MEKFSKPVKKEPKQYETDNFTIDELQKYYQEFMLKVNGKLYIVILVIEGDMSNLKESHGNLGPDEKNKLSEDINTLIKDLKEDYRLNVNFLTPHDKQKYLTVRIVGITY